MDSPAKPRIVPLPLLPLAGLAFLAVFPAICASANALAAPVELEPNPDPTVEWIVEGRTVALSGHVRFSRLILRHHAVVTHPPQDGPDARSLFLEVGHLTIDATSRIDVSARGFPGVRNPDSDASNRPDPAHVGVVPQRHGGSHGGLGGRGNVPGDAIPPYGDHRQPRSLGLGGSADIGSAGDGGGLLRLVADTLELDGSILANGGPGSLYGGGGAGGSIEIQTRLLLGAGEIRADGGHGSPQSGGGGGGRVAVLYRTASGGILDRISTLGGTGHEQGAPGTLFTIRDSTPGRLIIRGPGRETPLPADTSGDLVTVDGARVQALSFRALELFLRRGAVLTHVPPSPGSHPGLSLAVDHLVIEAGSHIDAAGRGYPGAQTQTNPDTAGRTLNFQPGSRSRHGGSHAGLGGFGNIDGNPNAPYGEPSHPNTLGSGGGSDNGPAGDGGGRIAIIAQRLELHGTLSVRGTDGSRYGGGGSGGSILIQADYLSGSGSVLADGGAGGLESGGGGGGLIAIRYLRSDFPASRISSQGGDGYQPGAPGSVLVEPRF
ncbi:MAG: hypothetical protein KF833_12600 [Verrucomicrobiae bacterium]|nr:hypothetical protein [Verrucomicrobiae bacterium]